MSAESREERKILRKKRKREAMLFYVKVLFFAIMVLILVWCVYAFFSESNIIKDRRDTGQLLTKSLNK